MKALLPAGGPNLVEFGEVDKPAPGPGAAVIRVEAFSVNRGETFLLEKPQPGWRPGKDIAGLVVQGAADGSGPAAGTRVVAHPPASGWAEYAAVETSSIAELPAEISAVSAAALPLAGLTALRMLRLAGGVTGRRVLLTGASGGVGHYVVELAASAGAEVTAISAAPDRGSRLTELGASAVLGRVTDATGPFDLVLESVGRRRLPSGAGAAGAGRHAHLVRPGQPRAGDAQLLRPPAPPAIGDDQALQLCRLAPVRRRPRDPGPAGRPRPTAPGDRSRRRLGRHRPDAHRPA